MSKKIKVHNSQTGYNLASDLYDKREAYLNSFEKGKVIEILGDVRDKKILDVGAGTGRLSIMLAKNGAEVTALDVSEEMLKVLHKKSRKIITVVGDVESLPFSENSFDIVVAAFLIVHLKEPKYFFDEAYRVLKDGGYLFVTNINQKEPPIVKTKEGEIIIESFYHRPDKIKEDLEDLAFSIEKEKVINEGGVWINQIILAKK